MRNPRATLIFILILIFGATIIGRLFYIQILKYDENLAYDRGQKALIKPITPNRG